MATIVYSLSSKKDKTTGQQEILVRFFHGRINQRAKTNIFTTEEYWDAALQCNRIPKIRVMSQEKIDLVRQLQQQNDELKNLAAYIQNSFIEDGAGKLPLPEKWLSVKLLERTVGPSREDEEEEAPSKPSTVSLLEHFIQVHHISETQQRQYKVLLRALQRYSRYTNTSTELDDLSPDVLRDFENYLVNEHRFVGEGEDGKPTIIDPLFKRIYAEVPECRLPKPRGKNYLIGLMTRFRTFVKWAKKNKYTSNEPFEDYEMGTPVYGTPYYLTKEERDKLYHTPFPDNPGLEIQRDIFVFQCFIGCRVGDLNRFRKSSVINDAVEYVARKTVDGRPITVRVPLTNTTREIIERYSGITGDKLLPFICEQDYNKDIKKMLRLAGIDRQVTILNALTRMEEQHPIWEVASSHMARRVMIGNLYAQVKDPNLIAKLSGHVENSKAFNRYRTIDEQMARDLVNKLE